MTTSSSLPTEAQFQEDMESCEECGSLLPADKSGEECDQCGASVESLSNSHPPDERAGGLPNQEANLTNLESLPTTKSGSIKKEDSMEWLESRSLPSRAALKQSLVEKPRDFSGSTFSTEISTVRVTGDPHFIETVAGLFTWIGEMEDGSRRVEINLKQTEDREDGQRTGNYALYLSVTERG